MVRCSARRSSHNQFALCLFLSAISTVFAQQPLTEGTVVTGQCYGHGARPGCVLPNLYGPYGLSLNPTNFRHYAHFIGSAQDTLNTTLGTAIATQLALLPIISPASGFTYRYDSNAGAFVRSTTNFGPIYTERAETIGRGKFYFGVSYQRFRFDKLDGIDLTKVPSVFKHVPHTGMGGAVEPYEHDVITATNNASLHMDQTMLFGTVGITDRIDVSLAVPIVSVRVGASSDDTIDRVSGDRVTLTTGVTINNPHQFANGTLTNVYAAKGRALGLGDITVRVKGDVLRKEALRVALAMDIRTPTGNASEYLGSGAIGIKPFIAISAGKRISPHVNLGYQWNGSSILAGNITGSTISENASGSAVIQNGPAIKHSLPSDFFFSGGADVGVTSRLSLAFDYLGQTVFNAPQIYSEPYSTMPVAGGPPQQTFPSIEGRKATETLNSAAAGFKFNLFGGFLLTADVLFRLDNNGLRQDVTPLIAISRAFGK